MEFKAKTLEVITDILTADVSERLQVLHNLRLILDHIHLSLGPQPVGIKDDGHQVVLSGPEHSIAFTLSRDSRGLGMRCPYIDYVALDEEDPEDKAASLLKALTAREDFMRLFATNKL